MIMNTFKKYLKKFPFHWDTQILITQNSNRYKIKNDIQTNKENGWKSIRVYKNRRTGIVHWRRKFLCAIGEGIGGKAIRFMEMYYFFQTELIVALDFHSSLNEIPFVEGDNIRKGRESLGFYNRWAEKSVLFLNPSIYEEFTTLSFLLTSIRVLEKT